MNLEVWSSQSIHIPDHQWLEIWYQFHSHNEQQHLSANRYETLQGQPIRSQPWHPFLLADRTWVLTYQSLLCILYEGEKRCANVRDHGLEIMEKVECEHICTYHMQKISKEAVRAYHMHIFRNLPGVKSAGWLKRIAHCPFFHSWKLSNFPWVVSIAKSGTIFPRRMPPSVLPSGYKDM